jgi:hypothetical protein
MNRYKIIALLMMLTASLSSCYQEDDVVTDLWESKGGVGNISVFGVGSVPGYTLTTSITVAPAASVNLYMQYFAPEGTTIKEIRLYQRVGATTSPVTLISTIPFSGSGFDATARQYISNIPFTAPNTRGATVALFAELVTTNENASVRRSVTVRTTN